MKNLFILLAFLFITKNYSQESELFRTWYLTKVTVNNINYIPSDYGYFPELYIMEEGDYYYIALADPMNETCSALIENFQTNPEGFTVNQDSWLCFPLQTCSDGPNGPCTTIYGKHSEIFYGITSLFTYSIVENSDETFTLEIINSEGNHSYYNSTLLSTPIFSQTQLMIYPNPVTDILTLSSKEGLKEVAMYDIHGRLVETIRFNNNNSVEMDVRHLQNGLYFLKIETENSMIATERFIKK